MSNFNYNGQCKFPYLPCVDVRFIPSYHFKYEQRQIVYVKKKAEMGIFEKVAIKNRYAVGNPFHFLYNYTDTLNELYEEDELILYDEARDLVEQYNAYVASMKSRCVSTFGLNERGLFYEIN